MFLFLRSLLEIETLAILIVACFAFDFKVKDRNIIDYFLAFVVGGTLSKLLCVCVAEFFKYGETGLAIYFPFWIILIASIFAHKFFIYVFKHNNKDYSN